MTDDHAPLPEPGRAPPSRSPSPGSPLRRALAAVLAIYVTRRSDPSTAIRMVLLMQALAGRGAAGRWAAGVLHRSLVRRFAAHVSPTARFGRRCRMPHPVGIVVGDGVVVGNDCVIYQGVTLGASRRSGASSRTYPRLEDGVVVFAGAVIVGPVTLGRGATIGANAVVTADVPPGATAVGIPARVVEAKPAG